MNLLPNKDIRLGMGAYNVATRLYSTDGIPLKVSRILKAMKMANKVMSIKCLQVWIEKYKPYLKCNDKPINNASSFFKKRKLFLYPHEFLILLAQSSSNIEMLSNVLTDITQTKLADKYVNATLKRAEINGFDKFIRNEMRDYIDAKFPEKAHVRLWLPTFIIDQMSRRGKIEKGQYGEL